MRNEIINENIIVFYNSIRECPEWKWQLLQSVVVQDENIGSTLEDFAKHFEKFDIFLHRKKYDELLEERVNLTFNFNAIINKISVKSRALVCLISSINGDKIDISSEDKFDDVYKLLLETDISNGQVEDLLGELKKKLLLS